MQKTIHTPSKPSIIAEDILVIKRADLFAKHQAFQGLNTKLLTDTLNIITQKKEFLPRSFMEVDPTYKQIIPYLVFNYENRYFLMQRQSQASEQRLKNKYTLGIGGHIRHEDMQSESIFDWSQREFNEEVHYTGTVNIEPLGVLNDDTNDVGRVHLGLVLLVTGQHDNISIKSELKSGIMLTLEEMNAFYDNMESWSQTVYRFLCSQK